MNNESQAGDSHDAAGQAEGGKPSGPGGEVLRDFFSGVTPTQTQDLVFVLADEEEAPEAEPVEVSAAGTAPEGSALEIEIEPRFEVHSAPVRGEPVVHTLVRIKPRGAPLVRREDGPVAHVILCLDLSASMDHPDKYPVLKEGLIRMLLEHMINEGPDVLLSVVVFGYGSETVLKMQPLSQIDPDKLVRAIDRSQLRFTRYTDLVGALNLAGCLAARSHQANRKLPLRIVVLTDGKPQDVDGALERMSKIARLPTDVDGLCFGPDADVAAMKRILCGHRGGTVKHVDRESLAGAFQRMVESAQTVVAKRSLLSFELAPGLRGGAAFRFRPGRHSFGTGAFYGGRKFSVDLGTLESGRDYSLLFQLRLPEGKGDETEVGSFSVRVPGYGGPQTYEKLLSIPRHRDEDIEIAADPVVIQARHILEVVDQDDLANQIRSLRARKRLYEAERRDPFVVHTLGKAIEILERGGSLDEELTSSERAAMIAHTRTVVAGGAT